MNGRYETDQSQSLAEDHRQKAKGLESSVSGIFAKTVICLLYCPCDAITVIYLFISISADIILYEI